MRSFAVLLAVSGWALGAAGAPAQETSTASLIDDLEGREGQAYEAARDAVLGRPDVLEAARAIGEGTAYGASTWQRLVLAEALAMHVTHREEAALLRDLEGLRSEHYRLARRPEPSAARELMRLRHVAPLLIELFLKGVETYRWSSPAAAPAEEAALREGLLFAIGRSDHAASLHFLSDVIAGGCVCCESCDSAAAALGETGKVEALPVLLRVLEEARANGEVDTQATVVEALGWVRHIEAWPHVESRLADVEPRLRRAALEGAARFASRRGWRHDPATGAEVRALVGTAALQVLLDEEDEEVVEFALGALIAAATPELRERIEGLRAAAPNTAAAGAPADGDAAWTGRAADRLRIALDEVERNLARQRPAPPRDR
ncbi:MAG: hypothetical protein F4Y57_03530 [Acidobacteria bacterium]|nr:hypothetical protein [Acidobacteriota bacterium]